MDGTPIDLDKLRSIGFLGRGRTRDKTREWRDDAGRHRATQDELGNTTTEHSVPGHTEDRQDVMIRPRTIRLQTGVSGEKGADHGSLR